MKRAHALVPLSREHHEALVLARHAASIDPDGPGASTQRDHVLARWQQQFEPHFDTEERTLLPALEACGHAPAAQRALADHAQLRRLTARLRDGEVAALRPWGEAMQRHVHFEERELFPLAERVLDLDSLAGAMDRPSSRPGPMDRSSAPHGPVDRPGSHPSSLP
jgi:hemerythrin-like domain-containing protein